MFQVLLSSRWVAFAVIALLASYAMRALAWHAARRGERTLREARRALGLPDASPRSVDESRRAR